MNGFARAYAVELLFERQANLDVGVRLKVRGHTKPTAKAVV